MDRRGFLRACGAGVFGLSRLALGAEGKPNIVLIMADDLGYECLGCDGGTSYHTPNLDRLAAEGVRFTNAFCTPLCSPTRIEIMTGRYGFRNYRGWGVLDPKEVTVGHLLRKAGYATCVSGKWQLARFDRPENADQPRRAGFDGGLPRCGYRGCCTTRTLSSAGLSSARHHAPPCRRVKQGLGNERSPWSLTRAGSRRTVEGANGAERKGAADGRR